MKVRKLPKGPKLYKKWHPKGWEPRTERASIALSVSEHELIVKHFGSIADVRDFALAVAKKGIKPDEVVPLHE